MSDSNSSQYHSKVKINNNLMHRLNRINRIFYSYIEQIQLYQEQHDPFQHLHINSEPSHSNWEDLINLESDDSSQGDSGEGGGTIKGLRQKNNIPKLTLTNNTN